MNNFINHVTTAQIHLVTQRRGPNPEVGSHCCEQYVGHTRWSFGLNFAERISPLMSQH